MQIKVGGQFDSSLGDQADNFAAHNRDAVAFRFALDHFEHAMDGRLLEISQVNGNLRQVASAQVHSHGFHVTQAAVREPNILADAIGDADV